LVAREKEPKIWDENSNAILNPGKRGGMVWKNWERTETSLGSKRIKRLYLKGGFPGTDVPEKGGGVW